MVHKEERKSTTGAIVASRDEEIQGFFALMKCLSEVVDMVKSVVAEKEKMKGRDGVMVAGREKEEEEG